MDFLSLEPCKIERFCQNFQAPRVSRVYWQLFTKKIIFPPLLEAILNFCVKCKNTILEMVQDGTISTKVCDPQGTCRVYWRLYTKNAFLPLLTAILNFHVKRKSTFILETVQDRVISTKFWTCRVSAESTSDFSQKSLSHHYWQPS